MAADSLSALTLVGLAALGGGHQVANPLLVAAPCMLAWLCTWAASSGRSCAVPSLSWALLGLGVLSCLQAIPVGGILLTVLNPRWADLSAFLEAGQPAAWSYEPRRSAEHGIWLISAGLLAMAVSVRQAQRRDTLWCAFLICAAGLASLAAGLTSRMLGLDDILGLVPSSRHPRLLLSAFANPNHGAAFAALAAMCALAFAARRGTRKHGGATWLLAGLMLASSLAHGSRGATGALVVGLALIASRLTHQRRRAHVAAWLAVGLSVALILLTSRLDPSHWYSDFDDPSDPWGVRLKYAAVKDSLSLIGDHLWFGIGRGAYVSVYPAYKSSPYHLTFTHPENLVAQLTSEWGILVGGAALAGLVAMTVRRPLQSQTTQHFVLSIALAVLLAHNLVDFSLELPAVMLAAACLAAATTRLARVRDTPKAVAFGAASVAGCLLGGYLSTGPSLATDLATPSGDVAALRAAIDRHPSQAVLWARLAYSLETGAEEDLRAALEAANKALVLAPTYADGRLLTGRILCRLGARDQGLEAMRPFLALRTDADALDPFIDSVTTCARSPDDMMRALPRRDALTDQLHPTTTAAVARRLAAGPRRAWVVPLVRASIDSADPATRLQLARAAFDAGEWGLVVELFEAHPSKPPPRLRRMAVVSFMNQGRPAAAVGLISDEESDASVLFAGLDAALQNQDGASARALLSRLRRHQMLSRSVRISFLEREAQVMMLLGRRSRALQSLNDALMLAPGRPQIRLTRARLLMDLGRLREAQRDLESVLRSEPNHPAARQLLRSLRADSPSLQ